MISDDPVKIAEYLKLMNPKGIELFYSPPEYDCNYIINIVNEMLSSNIFQFISKLLPDKTSEVCSSQGLSNGYLFCEADVRNCLLFSASKIYNIESNENEDLVRTGYIPFFNDIGGNLICVNKEYPLSGIELIYLNLGYCPDDKDNPDARIIEAQRLDFSICSFFEFLAYGDIDSIFEFVKVSS